MLQWLIEAIEKIPGWVPTITSIVATTISVLAYRRASPPSSPTIWLESRGKKSQGQAVILKIKNITRWPVHLHDVKARPCLDAIAHQPGLDPTRQYSHQPYRDPVWASSLTFDVLIEPDAFFEAAMLFRNASDISNTRTVMDLSISMMRQTIKKRQHAVNIIVSDATMTKS